MTHDNRIIDVPLADVKSEIWESDLLLLCNRRGRPVRAAKAAWWNEDLFCVDARKFGGVTAVSLEQLVRNHPGRIDVYEVNPQNQWPNYDRQGATRHLKKMLFPKTALSTVLLKYMLKLIFATQTGVFEIPYGAAAIREADRLGGGVDPLPGPADDRAEPSDLASSSFYRYRFTLR